MIQRIAALFLALSAAVGCSPSEPRPEEQPKQVPAREVDPATFNFMSEAEEIRFGEAAEARLIKHFQDMGYDVDVVDKLQTLPKLSAIMKNIVAVSHRPRLPWRIHFVSSPEVNAFALPGGKIFFFKGMYDALQGAFLDKEIAAVLSHEIAHVTCKHAAERTTWPRLALTPAKDDMQKVYQPVYTAQHEVEADRIGLLYMALSGYEPEFTKDIWIRFYEKYRDTPVPYTVDHSVETNHYHRSTRLTLGAKQYYFAQQKPHPAWLAILKKNVMVTYEDIQDPGYSSARLALVLSAYDPELERQLAEKRREQDELLAQKNRKETLMKMIQIGNVRKDKSDDGKDAVFAEVANGSPVTYFKSIVLLLRYQDASGNIVLLDQKNLDDLGPGEKKTTGFFLREVPNTTAFQVVVHDFRE